MNMDGIRDDSVVELLRKCAAQDHGMARLRDALGIGLESGWQLRCLAEVADMIEAELGERDERIEELEAELEAEREESAFFEAERDRLYKVLAGMERTHMKLPVDADGAPIRPGDYMQMAFGESAEVVAVDSERWFFDQSCLALGGEEYDWEWAENSHHFKLDTVEGLLEEFERRYALCLHIDYTGDDTPGGLREEYAERIRKAVHDGD